LERADDEGLENHEDILTTRKTVDTGWLRIESV
jgi:hypothetical protein